MKHLKTGYKEQGDRSQSSRAMMGLLPLEDLFLKLKLMPIKDKMNLCTDTDREN